MKSRVAMLVGLAVLAGVSGCGTAANAVWLNPEEGGKRVYGGVRADWEMIRERGEDGKPGKVSTPVMAAFDLPLSIVADTFTLPYIAAYNAGLFGREETTHASDRKW